VDAILRRLLRLAASRGWDNLAWYGVAAIAWSWLRLRRRSRDAVFRIPMQPGERLAVIVRDQELGEDLSGRT
jgi:hypothetical protein